MRPVYLATAVVYSTAFILSAQIAPEEGSRNRGIDSVEIPLPMVSPHAVDPISIPLTAKEKAALAFRDTFYPRAVANRLLISSIAQLADAPSEWPGGFQGYGMRIGDRMGALATSEAIELGGNVLFHTEPRYDLCNCDSVKGRIAHAWKRVLTARTDRGTETIGIANIASDLGTPWVTHQWLPDRVNDPSHIFVAGVSRIGFRGVTNMLREFWPDIARATHMPARFRDRQLFRP